MRRNETETTMGFLCSGCLRSQDVSVPTTADIMKDISEMECRLEGMGWSIIKAGYDTRYHCVRCSNKGKGKPQERFVQNTLFD